MPKPLLPIHPRVQAARAAVREISKMTIEELNAASDLTEGEIFAAVEYAIAPHRETLAGIDTGHEDQGGLDFTLDDPDGSREVLDFRNNG